MTDSEQRDLSELSSLGHFLKGSSAILGVKQVEKTCETIEHYGKLRDHAAGVDLERGEALERINKLLSKAKKQHAEAVKWLKKWYAKKEVALEEPQS